MLFLSRPKDDLYTSQVFLLSFSLSACRPRQFPDLFWQSSWWIITKLGMWVGIAPLQCTIECRSGRMHRRHAPLTLMAKNTRNRGFRSISRIVIDGWSPNLTCGLVLPPYWTLFTAVPVGCTGVTHHWLWWLKTLETEVSAAFLTEFLMDDHQTWHVGWYCHPTEPY